MNDKIKQFIKNEKEIAEYKLSLLRASSKRAYTERLILKEEEYIEFPFESLDLKDIEEARKVLQLFRVDRYSFNKKYPLNIVCKSVTKSQISNLKVKLNFLEESYKNLISKELSSVDLARYNLKSNHKIGGALFQKEVARIQIMICCLSRFMYSQIKEIRKDISGDLEKREVLDAKASIDTVYDRAMDEMFKYYNESIEQTYELLYNTDSKNDFIPSIYPLVNLVVKIEDFNLKISRVLPVDKNFFSKTGKPILKKSNERGFSIVTPINRVGNETVELLYRSIYSESGICLNQIIENDFYNIKTADGTYCKAISTIPVWKMLSNNYDAYLNRQILELLGLAKASLQTIDFSNPEFVETINKSNFSVNISMDMSKIFIAATRPEADKIIEAKKYIDLLIKDLKEEYNNKFLSTSTGLPQSDLRKDKIKEIIGSIGK